jgi:hypothetical protein
MRIKGLDVHSKSLKNYCRDHMLEKKEKKFSEKFIKSTFLVCRFSSRMTDNAKRVIQLDPLFVVYFH